MREGENTMFHYVARKFQRPLTGDSGEWVLGTFHRPEDAFGAVIVSAAKRMAHGIEPEWVKAHTDVIRRAGAQALLEQWPNGDTDGFLFPVEVDDAPPCLFRVDRVANVDVHDCAVCAGEVKESFPVDLDKVFQPLRDASKAWELAANGPSGDDEHEAAERLNAAVHELDDWLSATKNT